MKSTVQSRQRIARVRSLQHRLALIAEQGARATLEQLDQRSALIDRLHGTMVMHSGPATGSILARSGELSSRFAVAGLTSAEERVAARSRLDILTTQRVAAERTNDGAAKLLASARCAHSITAEKRAGRQSFRRKAAMGSDQ